MIYFNEYNDEYLLSEICILCDFTTKQLRRELDTMISKGLLTNELGIFRLTAIAIEFLKEKGLLNANFEDLQSDMMTLNISEKKLNFEDVFIPVDFKL